MQTIADEFVTVGECAEEIDTQAWRIARLFETLVIPEPPRLGNRRIIPRSLIPRITQELTARGWLNHQRVSRSAGILAGTSAD